MQFWQSHLLKNMQDTQQIAAQLASQIKPGQVVFLHGELGVGKTTFVQALLAAWGFDGLVTSPTYTLVEPYQFQHFIVYHFDLYRIKDPEELAYIGLSEYFHSQSICLIEWPERASGMLPTPDWLLKLSYNEDQTRSLVIERPA